MSRITAEQAQALLDAAVPTRWRVARYNPDDVAVVDYVAPGLPPDTVALLGLPRAADLIAAAPALAAAVVRLEDDRDALAKALEERECDMHMRIRQGYDRTVADLWRAEVARVAAERDALRECVAAWAVWRDAEPGTDAESEALEAALELMPDWVAGGGE